MRRLLVLTTLFTSASAAASPRFVARYDLGATMSGATSTAQVALSHDQNVGLQFSPTAPYPELTSHHTHGPSWKTSAYGLGVRVAISPHTSGAAHLGWISATDKQDGDIYGSAAYADGSLSVELHEWEGMAVGLTVLGGAVLGPPIDDAVAWWGGVGAHLRFGGFTRP